MAIKGNFNGSSSNGWTRNSNRGRPYGVMLLIAFGAALLGVLVVHKLREWRIFNLLVTDKEQQLYSLHLLLQKEREQSSEMKRKAEDMKAAVQKVTAEKMELERRVAELHSTIDSLKEEGKALEIALEEKQSEIELLGRDLTSSEGGDKEDNPQVAAALTESLKQKEAENQDLKKHRHRHRHHHRGVETPVKVWRAGSDEDPSSNPLSTNGTKAADDAVVVGQEKKDDASRKLSDVENNGSDNWRTLPREEGLLPAAGSNGTTSHGEAARKRKHFHSRKAGGKKWRVVARNRRLGNNKMDNGNVNGEEDEGDKRSTTSIVKEIAAVDEQGDSPVDQLSKPENSEEAPLKRDDRSGKGTSKLEECKVLSQTDGVTTDGSSNNVVNHADSMHKESEPAPDSSEQERDRV